MSKNPAFNKSWIVKHNRDHGYWPCVDCSKGKEVIWHAADEVVCPVTKKPREEAENQAKELK